LKDGNELKMWRVPTDRHVCNANGFARINASLEIPELLSGNRSSNCPGIMNDIKTTACLAPACRRAVTILAVIVSAFSASAQNARLEKMPTDLETDFALSSLPPHLRDAATVYLLDPDTGYYVSRKGSNGFICLVIRTEWDRGEFRDDLFSPISFDAAGAKAIFPSYDDIEKMRSSGKYTALQIKEIFADRFNKGIYKAPARPGVSYMLAPLMRTYDASGLKVITFAMPHYMFYAPHLTDADVGGNPQSNGLFILGDGKNPHGYMILPAGAAEKVNIL
jgi:hypothetical protein